MKNNVEKFTKNLIPIEIVLGFVRVPNKYKKLFPKMNSNITFYLGNSKKGVKLHYNSKHQHITGLVNFFRLNNAKPRDVLEFEKTRSKEFVLRLKKTKGQVDLGFSFDEAREIIDPKKIKSSVKGRIVENRIKEILVLYSQGLLSVYEPESDTRGIDLIVLKEGSYLPIFLQVKGKFNLRGNNFQIGVRRKTLIPHKSLFIVGAYFNPQKMDLDDYLVFIPSKEFVKRANLINRNTERAIYVLNTPLTLGGNNRFSSFIIRKENLVSKIFEEFNNAEKHLK